MIKPFLVMIALLLSVSAHSASFKDADIEAKLNALKSRLELTEAQTEKLTPVLEKSATQRQEILKKHGIDPENRSRENHKKLSFREKRALGKELKAVKQETQSAVKGILTPAQYETYQQIQAERKEEMRKRFSGGH